MEQDDDKNGVLVVGGHPAMWRASTSELAKRGLQVVHATDVEDAASRLWEQPFDLVVTDNETPPMCGFELLHLMHLRHPGVPVIMVSAFADYALRETARLWGAVAVLHKPFEIEELLAVVTAALNRKAKATVMPERGGEL